MIGYLRLLLAFFVLGSHVAGVLGYSNNFHLGVFAVCVFYILAGHVVSKIFRIYVDKGKPTWFYVDRILRIYPSYFLSFFIAAVFVIFTDFGCPHWHVLNLLNNLLIIPLNFFMYINDYVVIIKCAEAFEGYPLIPQAWSLGTELMAYSILPVFLIFKQLRFFGFIMSFFIFMLAKVGILHPDYWGYRLLPGVLFFFLAGSIIQDWKDEKASKVEIFMFVSVWFFSLLFLIVFVLFFQNYCIYTLETLSGFVLGSLMVGFGIKSRLKLPLDRLFGFLSYGIFLNHFTAIWILKHFSLFDVEGGYLRNLFLVSILTVFMAILNAFIDGKIFGFRVKKHKA